MAGRKGDFHDAGEILSLDANTDICRKEPGEIQPGQQARTVVAK